MILFLLKLMDLRGTISCQFTAVQQSLKATLHYVPIKKRQIVLWFHVSVDGCRTREGGNRFFLPF